MWWRLDHNVMFQISGPRRTGMATGAGAAAAGAVVGAGAAAGAIATIMAVSMILIVYINKNAVLRCLGKNSQITLHR